MLPPLQMNFDGHFSDHNKAAAEEPVGEESKIEGRECSRLPSPCISMQNHSIISEHHWRIAGEIAIDNWAHNAAKGQKVKLQKLPSGRWHFDFGTHLFEDCRNLRTSNHLFGLDSPTMVGKRRGTPLAM